MAARAELTRREAKAKALEMAHLSKQERERAREQEKAKESGRSAPIFPEYRDDPCGFARDVLGVRLWRAQRRILESIARRKRVAVCAGQKTGKSTTFVVTALWWAGTRARGRVLFTGPTNDQVDTVLWTELHRVVNERRADGRRVVDVLGVKPAVTPQTGMQWPDGREILGRVADSPTSTQGFSGPEILIIIDEGSGVADDIFEAHEGNTAGGGSIVTAGNPNHEHGWFYRAFNSEAQFWDRHVISSEDTPNITGEEERIDGLAELEFVEAMRAKYGREHPFYKIRVLGQFAGGQFQYIPAEAIKLCQTTDDLTRVEGDQHYAGLDIGRSNDLTVLVVLRYVRGIRYVVYVRSMKRTDSDGIDKMVDEAFTLFRLKRLCIDATGMGTFPADRIKKKHSERVDVPHRRPRVEPVIFTPKMKETLVTGLHSVMTTAALQIPANDNALPGCEPGTAEKLRKDIASIARNVTKAGNVTYDTPRDETGHGDHAWATALAVHASTGRNPMADALLGTG